MVWEWLIAATEVASSEVVAVEVGELELVVWRTRQGDPVVMDARCPHQWSHLAAEGVVDGDEIVCAAHFWRFDTAGCGSKLTVRGRRDPKGPIGIYPCREIDGAIEVGLDPPPPPGGT